MHCFCRTALALALEHSNVEINAIDNLRLVLWYSLREYNRERERGRYGPSQYMHAFALHVFVLDACPGDG